MILRTTKDHQISLKENGTLTGLAGVTHYRNEEVSIRINLDNL
jgi:hypothetical protein